MSRSSFHIAFEGPAVADGEIDVNDLAPALVALGDVLQSAKSKGRPMPRHTARANAKKSAVRAHVAHPFAHRKGPMGLVIRTIGLARATATVTLANMAYIMRRWCWLDSRNRGYRRHPFRNSDPGW